MLNHIGEVNTEVSDSKTYLQSSWKEIKAGGNPKQDYLGSMKTVS